MATPEQLAQFRKQTKELLTPSEVKDVKDALGEFMEDKDIPFLVAALENVIDTAEKHVLFQTIGCFVPPHYREDYDSHCPSLLKRDKSYRRNSEAKKSPDRVDREVGEADVASSAAALSIDHPSEGEPTPDPAPLPLQSPVTPTVYKNHIPQAAPSPKKTERSPTIYKNCTPAPASAPAPAPAAEMPVQPPSTHTYVNHTPDAAHVIDPFNSAPASPEDSAPMGTPRAATPPMAEHVDDSYMELAPNQLNDIEPVASRTSSAEGGGKLPPLRPPDAMMIECPAVPEDKYLLGCITRPEAEGMLRESGMIPGAFLIRQKDDLTAGSMKIKPGQKVAGGSWVLSYVAPTLEFSHQLIIQADHGGVLEVGGKDLGRCTSLDQLIRHLRTVEGYYLDRPPYHAQPWYHGDITREDAERRLFKVVPVPGTYLIRKSLRDPQAWVLSLLTPMGVPAHNMIRLSPDGYYTDDEPAYLYEHLPTLLLANAHPNGFRLAAICPKPRPVGGRRRGGR